MRRLRHEREIVLPALSPIWRVFWFYNEVGAVETNCGTATHGTWRKPATATSSLGLEHAPTVLASMDNQIGFFEDEVYIVATELLAGTATERSIAGGDALAHLTGQPIGGKETVERRRRFALSLMVD